MRTTYNSLIQDVLFKHAIESFLRVEEISDIVILGKEGGIRRIIFGDDDSLLSDLVRKSKEDLRIKLKKEGEK